MSAPRPVIQPVVLGLLVFSLAIHGGLAAAYVALEHAHELIDIVTLVVVLGASLLLSVLKPLVRAQSAFIVVVGLHVALSVAVHTVLEPLPVGLVAWTAVVTVESVMYLRRASGSVVALLLLLSHAAMAVVVWNRGELVTGWDVALSLLLLALITTGAVTYAGYREELVTREKDLERLDGAVLRLSRANTSYQQYALDVEERSTELERQRITRDIHDIVGYALTNSVVTMEAAVDMIRVEPLRVPALLQSARDNAEEGLSRIRESLYRLRSQETRHPRGIAGISRMVSHFREATGLEVQLEAGGVPPIVLTEKVDHVVHHFVQEAIINSFRHGRASRILVMLYWSDDRFIATVWDDGPGVSATDAEGIGISGMRERAAQLSGEISYERVIDGFTISLTIPRKELS